jgi:hypothetical protein
MLAALSKESLSIAADESLPFVRRNVRERIKLLRVAAYRRPLASTGID